MTLDKPHTRALTAALIAGGMAVTATAQAETQGLYSADELLDADVYTQADPDKEIGEVEDVLLDNDMRLRALVIDTGNLLDMGQKQYVIETDHFSVETHNGSSLDDMEYSVHVDLSEQAITQQPEYTDTWWSEARQNMQKAWDETKEGAASAWDTTQEGASEALDRIGNALKAAGEKTQQAAEDTTQ